jgi:hypothetical protein
LAGRCFSDLHDLMDRISNQQDPQDKSLPQAA